MLKIDNNTGHRPCVYNNNNNISKRLQLFSVPNIATSDRREFVHAHEVEVAQQAAAQHLQL